MITFSLSLSLETLSEERSRSFVLKLVDNGLESKYVLSKQSSLLQVDGTENFIKHQERENEKFDYSSKLEFLPSRCDWSKRKEHFHS